MSAPQILFVDDEKDTLSALRRVFIDDNYEIITALSGQEGLKLLEENDIKLVIADYRMPGMDGIDFLKQVWASWPETVRIILSGAPDAQKAVEAIEEGQIYKFLKKPWDGEELRDLVSTALNIHSLREKNEEIAETLLRTPEKISSLAGENDSAQHTVLFVDDEPNILKTIKRLFIEEDFRILTASGGQEALDLIDSGESPSVIISDQRMPQMSGAEFLAKARQKLPQSIRMVLTGYADVKAAVDAINLGGIYRYIAKPWNDDELKMDVREAVERFELVEQNKRLTLELKEKNQELGEVNASLEVKVKERTRDLLESLNRNKRLNIALHQKVKELEGRDLIQQHLLTIHPLEETLQLVLEVISGLVKMDASAIFLCDQETEEAKTAAFLSSLENASSLFENKDNNSIFARYKDSLFKAISNGSPSVVLVRDIWLGDTPHDAVQIAFFPIRKGHKSLGAISAARISTENPFNKNNIKTISSFSMQAAVAIEDSLLKQELPSLEGVLDDVLMEFSDK